MEFKKLGARFSNASAAFAEKAAQVNETVTRTVDEAKASAAPKIARVKTAVDRVQDATNTAFVETNNSLNESWRTELLLKSNPAAQKPVAKFTRGVGRVIQAAADGTEAAMKKMDADKAK
jgi:uncharacterized phage infection (PIP) family protein YhgE